MVGRALVQVFSNGWYVLLAAMIALAIFVLTTWLGNLGLVWQIATSGWLPLADKARILVLLIGSISTNFTIFSAACAAVLLRDLAPNTVARHKASRQHLQSVRNQMGERTHAPHGYSAR